MRATSAPRLAKWRWPMRNEIGKHLRGFRSAVLTGLDRDGYPASVRCVPRFDVVRHLIDVDVPTGVGLRPGPACLLCHRHDERLWNLKSFVARGTLEQDDRGWHLRPTQFVPGMGIGGPL